MIWPHRTFSTSCNEYGAALLERSSPLLSWVPPVREGLDGATLSLGLCRRPATANTCRRHMPDPVRLALVGCGRIAQVAHLPAVEKAEGVELVAVSDPGGAVARSVAPLRPRRRLHRPGTGLGGWVGRGGGHRRARPCAP